MQVYKSALWNSPKIPINLKAMAPNPAETQKAIAERLELTRKALKYSTRVAFVATISGMTSQKWTNYTKGGEKIPHEIALEMCRKHQLSLDWIYRGHKEALPLRLVREIEALEAPQITPKPRLRAKKT